MRCHNTNTMQPFVDWGFYTTKKEKSRLQHLFLQKKTPTHNNLHQKTTCPTNKYERIIKRNNNNTMTESGGFSPFILFSLLDVFYLEIYNKQHKQLIKGKIIMEH